MSVELKRQDIGNIQAANMSMHLVKKIYLENFKCNAAADVCN